LLADFSLVINIYIVPGKDEEQRTENREQRTKNREQRIENREQRTENREHQNQGTREPRDKGTKGQGN
jgi:hypothetical protein